MNIGMVSTFLQKCGIATYSLFLSEALIKNSVNVTILAEHPFPDESAIAKDMHTEVPYFNCWKRTEFYDRLIKEIPNYDICHIQNQFGLFNNTYAWIKLLQSIKIPLVITFHDLIPPNEQLATYFNETFHYAKKLIVHTNACYDMLMRWNCPKDKIELVPHGTKIIDVPDKIEARKALGLPADAEILLSWGFIWESKGLLELVNILAELKESHPKAMLIHAGGIHPILQGSQYVTKILKEAIKLGLGPKDLMITQWVPEDKVPVYFGSAELIVLNYMRGSASASGAAHRAMAAHRPIVGTDDLCIEDIPKYEVPRFDLSSFYKGIKEVLENKELQQKLIRDADAAAEATSWSKIAAKHKKIYEKLV